jgi:predicted RNase H-like HicB family nuclease
LISEFGFSISDFKNRMKHKYEIILYWSKEDEAVIAKVPELAGCMADGTNYSEALENVEVVIEQWIQTAKSLGRDIPLPKGKLMYA